jgi:penicillin-binding protein 2
MAKVLGYVAAVSEKELTGEPLLELPGFRIGKNGIERHYDTELRGAAGNSHIEVNALGRVIREVSREEGTPGREAVLTLNAGLQNFVHQRLVGERSASAVVMDIHGGEVLALASVPAYDPNAFNYGLSSEAWHRLITDPLSPLTNKAISGLYSPGSTFKMIVALAALEAGVAPDYQGYCPGFMKLGNAKFHCWKRHGHGKVDMFDAITQSCDVYFYDMARRAGIDRISAMAKRFGLGATVGLDLPGEKGGLVPTREWKQATIGEGLVPTREWKQATIGESWQGGETLITAIGQGFILTSPLQLAVMTARLANGGRAVMPRLLRGFRDELAQGGTPDPAPEPLGLPEAHLAFIRKAMDAVTNHQRGTAYRRRIEREGWEMAGKTGTSQVRRITLRERAAGVKKNKDLPWRYRDHALFVAFAPVHQPRYCCAVVVEHGGGGSTTAAPIVRDILTETQRLDPMGGPQLSWLAEPASKEG